MHRYALLLLPLLVALPAGAGGDKFDPAARARALAPYLNEQTVAVFRIDLSRRDAATLALKLAEIATAHADAVDRTAEVRQWLADFTRAGGKELYFLFGAGEFFDAPLIVAPLGPGADSKEVARLLASGTFLPRGPFQQIKGAVVGGNPEAQRRLRTLKPEPRPDLTEAFAAAGDTTAQFLIVPTADWRRVVEEILPTLPKEFGGGPSTVVTRGLLWAAAGIQGPPKMGMKVVVQSQDADAARKLSDWLREALTALGRTKEVQRIFPRFDKLAAALRPKVEGDRLTLTLSEEQTAALVQPLVGEARLAAGRERSVANLKQLGIALFSYLDANPKKTFPPAALTGKDGKPLLSWRVAILPYIEQLHLYNQFKLDEPWDSPHNKKLIARMPPLFRSPFSRKGDEGKTVYLAPVGKDTAFPGREGTGIKDFADGTSNTILIVEATDERAVPWTKPADLPYNAKQPLAGLVAPKRHDFLATFADGSVHIVPVEIGLDNIRALFTRNGGEIITKPF